MKCLCLRFDSHVSLDIHRVVSEAFCDYFQVQASLTADEILNKWPEAEVARILRDYGEERRWKQLARKIVEKRLAGGIHSTSELVELIGGSAFGENLKKCFLLSLQ